MLILERPWTTKPEIPVPFGNNRPSGLHLYYPLQNVWYSAASNTIAPPVAGQQPVSTIYGIAAGVNADSGTAFVNGFAGLPIYGVFSVVNIRNNAIISTSTGKQLWSIDSSKLYCNIGSWTGYLTNETIAIGSADASNDQRQGITSTIGLGVKIISWLWNGSNYIGYINGIYDASLTKGSGNWVPLKTATTGSITLGILNSSGQPAIDVLATAVTTNALPGLTTQLVMSDVRFLWSMLKPRRIYIPTPAAAAAVPTLSASTYVPGSMTSTGWRPQITAS